MSPQDRIALRARTLEGLLLLGPNPAAEAMLHGLRLALQELGETEEFSSGVGGTSEIEIAPAVVAVPTAPPPAAPKAKPKAPAGPHWTARETPGERELRIAKSAEARNAKREGRERRSDEELKAALAAKRPPVAEPAANGAAESDMPPPAQRPAPVAPRAPAKPLDLPEQDAPPETAMAAAIAKATERNTRARHLLCSDMEESLVASRTGLPLREVLRLKAEVREARRRAAA